MATANHTQFGSRTRLTVTGTLTSYASGTRLAIEAQGWTLPCIVVTDKFDAVLSWSPVA